MSNTDDLYFTFELSNENTIDAEFEISENEAIDALFEINGNTQVRGEGTIDVNYINGVAVVTSKTYVYEQAIASDIWVINHNLNKQPSVAVADSAGTIQIPNEIVINDENTITLYFLAAFAGKAYLN